MSRFSHCHRLGFTLVELAVVLVIIGLIAGGILVGRDLLRTAELRHLIREVEQYKTASNAFRVKYNALPGDYGDAEAIWGSDASCPDTPANAQPKQATCNGNGNGRIGYGGEFPYVPGTFEEAYRFWQHLANAALIKGQYTGTEIVTSAFDSMSPGVNVPLSLSFNAAYDMFYLYRTFLSGGASPLALKYAARHYFVISRVVNLVGGHPTMPSESALTLDTKIDDGNPGEGTVIAYQIMYPPIAASLPTMPADCVTRIYTLPAQYDTTQRGDTCSLAVAAGF